MIIQASKQLALCIMAIPTNAIYTYLNTRAHIVVASVHIRETCWNVQMIPRYAPTCHGPYMHTSECITIISIDIFFDDAISPSRLISVAWRGVVNQLADRSPASFPQPGDILVPLFQQQQQH